MHNRQIQVFKLIGLLAVVGSLSFCKKDKAGDEAFLNSSWLRARVDEANNGNVQFARATPAAAPSSVWERDFNLGAHASLAVTGGLVLIQGEDSLKCVDVGKGSDKWAIPNYGGFVQPAIEDGVVYFGTDGDEFFAVNLATGAVLWQVAPEDRVRSCPVIVDDLVIFTDLDNIYALKKANGTFAWGHDILGSSSSPAYANGRIYVGNENGSLFCYDVKNGNQIWEFKNSTDPTGGPEIQSSPALLDGAVYFGDVDGKFYKVDASTGGLIWKYTTDGRRAFGSAAVAADKIYVTCTSTAPTAAPPLFVCLDTSTGKDLWAYSIKGPNIGDPIIVNEQVWFGDADGLHALDRQSGDVKWGLTNSSGVENALGVLDGRIIVGFSNGDLHCLEF